MRVISFETIVTEVRNLCIKATTHLPHEVMSALQRGLQSATTEVGRMMFEFIIENATIAARDGRPLCQDTGVAVFFVAKGRSVEIVGGLLEDAITQGTRAGYREGYLRKSIVGDPLYHRKNTEDNTPAIIHSDDVEGDTLTITFLPKGGGSENMSKTCMLIPSDGEAGVIDFVVKTVVDAGANPCPPVIVGVGIGGTAEKCAFLAKKALIRPCGQPHPLEEYSRLEQIILDRINQTQVGAQGLGGSITALAVHIETFPCHIASLPVSVNLNCHAARMARCIL